MKTDHSIPPLRDLPPGRLAERRRHLLAEIGPSNPQRFSRPLVLGVVVCLIAIAAGTLAVFRPGIATGRQPGPPVPADLADSQVSAAGYAGDQVWMLTPRGIQVSTSSGSWRGVDPPGVQATGIGTATFTDPSSGWVAAYGSPQADGALPIAVYRTSDGGSTWQSTTVDASPLFGNAASVRLSFATPSDGWLEVQTVSSSNFSNANLYRTTDGGVTWTKLKIPIAGAITFVSADDGFVSGGVTGGDLYATTDAGSSWQAVTLPGEPAGEIYGPAFTSLTDGLVSVTSPSVNGASITVYRTTDGGSTWTTPDTATVAEANGDIATPVASVKGGWLAAVGAGDSFVSLPAGADSANTRTASGLPSNDLGQITMLDFPTGSASGLALYSGGACEGFKTGCLQFSALYSTADGGSTWSQITP